MNAGMLGNLIGSLVYASFLFIAKLLWMDGEFIVQEISSGRVKREPCKLSVDMKMNCLK